MAGTDNYGAGNTPPRQPTAADLKPGTTGWRVNVAMCAHQFFGLVHDPEIAKAIGKTVSPNETPSNGAPKTVPFEPWSVADFSKYLHTLGLPKKSHIPLVPGVQFEYGVQVPQRPRSLPAKPSGIHLGHRTTWYVLRFDVRGNARQPCPGGFRRPFCDACHRAGFLSHADGMFGRVSVHPVRVTDLGARPRHGRNRRGQAPTLFGSTNLARCRTRRRWGKRGAGLRMILRMITTGGLGAA
jgi:hypothetical protein